MTPSRTGLRYELLFAKMKSYNLLTDTMEPTIEPTQSVITKEYPRCWCSLDNSILCVGFHSGKVSFIDSSGKVVDEKSVDGPVIGLTPLGGNIVVASSTSGLFSFGDDSWEFGMKAGCEIIQLTNKGVIAVDGSGDLMLISSTGELLERRRTGPVDLIASSEEGGLIGVGLGDGRLLILGEDLSLLHDSPSAEDDVETISCLEFRIDGTLVVGRNSLGMALDDRPENRIECWNSTVGLINSSEMPSMATSLCCTESGVMVGCFDGQMVKLDIGVDEYREISQLNYNISKIVKWKDDFLVTYWFDISRISPEGKISWQFEHQGIVEGLVELENGLVAVIGDDRKSRGPSPIFFIDPDSTILDDSSIAITSDESRNEESEFSGSLSADELERASSRQDFNIGGDGLMETLNEEIEIQLNDKLEDGDSLVELLESAKSLNIPPVADAGEDRTVNSDEEGKATILLDGTRSYDPDGVISKWAWSDGGGKEIGESPQIRVRLSEGVHNFSLTVTDNGGATAKANITIQVR